MNIRLEILNQYLFQNLKLLIEQERLNNKKIVLFGLNTTSYATKNYLESNNFKIYAYIDNDKRKRDEVNDFLKDILPNHISSFFFKKDFTEKFIYAYSPESLLEKFDDNVVILVASKYYKQMCDQLKKMGYQENNHIIQTIDFFGMENMLETLYPQDADRIMQQNEIRKSQLGILNNIKYICKEHGLKYYLCAGTLLGAIRHKGYIPWDDDIDISMPYEDYKKLINILIQKNGQYQIWSPYNYGEKCFCLFSRVIDSETVMRYWEYPFLLTTGVSIDIFPISGLPEKDNDINYYYKKIRLLQSRFINSYIENIRETKEINEERKVIHNQILNMLEQYSFNESHKVFMVTKYKEKEILPKSIYNQDIEVEFEGNKYNAPIGWDIYLSAIYGDYMKLPPENQRTTDHNFMAFWKKN